MDENVRFRLQQLEETLMDVKDVVDADREATLAHRQALHEEILLLRSDMAELLTLFKGAKSVIVFVRVIGRVTIALAAFAAAFKFCVYIITRYPWK
jgi:hypothetical protein